MVLPVGDQAFQQVGAAQERAVFRRRPAGDHVVAAAGARVAAVEHEFFRAQAAEARFLVEGFRALDHFAPAFGRLDVDFQHPRVRRHLDDVEARIVRRGVAFDMHGHAGFRRRVLDGGDQVQVILQGFRRRHEHANAAVTGLDGHGRADPALGAGHGLFGNDLAAAARMFRSLQVGLARGVRFGQFAAFVERVGGHDIGVIHGPDMGQGIQRQAVAHGGIAGDQHQAVRARRPGLAVPAPVAGPRVPALHGQDIARGLRQPAREHLAQAVPLQRIVELGILQGHVFRQAAFLLHEMPGVLKGGDGRVGRHVQAFGDAAGEGLGGLDVGLVVVDLPGEGGLVAPDRHPVAPPVEGEGPARQRLPRIPFALAEMQKAVRRVFVAQAADQVVAQGPLGFARGGGVPFIGVDMIDGYEGRLPTQGQAHVALDQLLVDLVAERVDRLPLFLRIGLGYPGAFRDAGDQHVEIEVDLAGPHGARDGGGASGARRRGQRDMPLAGQQARGGIEADPARARQIDLGPGVQVGEIRFRPRRPVEGLHVRLQLDQVARHEARGITQVAQDFDQQPARVAARPAAAGQGFLAGLHPRLHADQVFDFRLQALVQGDQIFDRAAFLFGQLVEPGPQQWPRRLGLQIGFQLKLQVRVVGKGQVLRVRFQKEVKGVLHRHVGDQIDRDLELLDRVRIDDAGLVVAVGVLLPVDEIALGLDLERIAEDRRAGVRGRAQADHLRAHLDLAVVNVGGPVVQGDMNAHGRDRT